VSEFLGPLYPNGKGERASSVCRSAMSALPNKDTYRRSREVCGTANAAPRRRGGCASKTRRMRLQDEAYAPPRRGERGRQQVLGLKRKLNAWSDIVPRAAIAASPSKRASGNRSTRTRQSCTNSIVSRRGRKAKRVTSDRTRAGEGISQAPSGRVELNHPIIIGAAEQGTSNLSQLKRLALKIRVLLIKHVHKLGDLGF
jgi:hypothetical protein